MKLLPTAASKMKTTVSIFVISILVLVDLGCSQLTGGEQVALLDLAASLTPLPSGWNTVNSTGACAWEGIACQGGHVVNL